MSCVSKVLCKGPTVLVVIFLFLFLFFYLWRRLKKERKEKNGMATRLLVLEKDLYHWKQESQKFLKEYQEMLLAQFSQWNLTETEKQVGLFLLAGLSFKNIAHARSTSEKTIRNQAISIYNKSGLGSRSEFAAFFLKELIVFPDLINQP